MQILPEDFLFSLLPEGVAGEDKRRILAALFGGMQDRLEDIRTLAGKQSLLLDPLAELPDTGASVLASWRTDQGSTSSRFIAIDETTPKDEGRLAGWAALKLGIPLTSAIFANDPLKAVQANSLQHAAANFGAILYKTPASGAVSSLDDQRRILAGYFPRLKLKGTLRSFEILGRLMGFSDVTLVPLWGRVSPRLPNDIGNSQNDEDFSAFPDQPPLQVISQDAYDPHNFFDGPFAPDWNSGPLSSLPADATFVTTVNGRQPWFKVVILAPGVTLPTGLLIFEGGEPHKKASVSPPGTSLRFEAIAEGRSFNGFSINASGTGGLSVQSQKLSIRKYRTSYYNLGLTLEFEAFSSRFGNPPVSANKFLQAFPSAYLSNSQYSNNGLAVTPFRPWAGGRLVNGIWTPRRQAVAAARQMNHLKLNEIGVQALQYFDEVRPATRFPRRVAFGFTSRDEAGYAAFNSQSILATVTANTAVYSGTAVGWPLPGYTVSLVLEAPASAILTKTAGSFTFEVPELQRPIQPGSVLIQVGSNSVIDDGFGTLSGTGLEGSIDYTAGIMQLSGGSETSAAASWRQTILLTGENEVNPNGQINPERIIFKAGGVSGYYQFNGARENYFDFLVTGWPTGTRLVARWSPTDTEVVRPEPITSPHNGRQGRPEDETNATSGAGFGLSEEVLWARQLAVGGFLSDRGTDRPADPPAQSLALLPGMTLMSRDGAEYDLQGIDPIPGSARPIRTRFIQKSTGPEGGLERAVPSQLETHRPSQLSRCQAADKKLHEAGIVGAVVNGHAVVVADPNRWASLWSGLSVWWPLNQHPSSELLTFDHAPIRANQPVLSGVQPNDRVWNPLRGWVTLFRLGARVAARLSLAPKSGMTVSAWTDAIGISTLHAGPVKISATLKTVTVSVITQNGSVVSAPSFSISELSGVVVEVGQKTLRVRSTALPGTVEVGLSAPPRFVEEVGRNRGNRVPSSTAAPAGYLGSRVSLGQYRVGDQVDYGGLSWVSLTPNNTTVPALGPNWRYSTTQIVIDSSGGAGTSKPVWHDVRLWSIMGVDSNRVLNPGLDGPQPASSLIHDPQVVPGAGAPLTPGVGDEYSDSEHTWSWSGTEWMTVILQQPHFYTVGQRSQLGLSALPCGWCYPGSLPPGRRAQNLARTYHYTGDGRWVGDRRLKEVGLGADATPPGIAEGTVWRLGHDFHDVSSDGVAVVASPGSIPGQSPAWGTRPTIVTQRTGGNLATTILPAPGLATVQKAQNAAQSFVWLRGDAADTGYVYQVKLAAQSGGVPVLVAERTFIPRSELELYQAARVTVNGQPVFQGPQLSFSEQPSGGENVVATNHGGLAVRRIAGQIGTDLAGEVYATADRALAGAPPTYLYLNNRIYSNAGQADLFDRWTNATNEGLDMDPPAVARNDAGLFELNLIETLPPGKYQLEVEASNYGTVDAAFFGFEVTIALKKGDGTQAAIITGRLVTVAERKNPRGSTIFEFVTDTQVEDGQIIIEWSNDADFPELHTNRTMVLHRMTFRKLVSSIHLVSVAAGPAIQITEVDLTGNSFSVNHKPGGWVTRLTNNGEFGSAVHESAIYPTLGETVSQLPLSDLLTGSTCRRRERMVVERADPSGVALPAEWVRPALPAPPRPQLGQVTLT